MIDRLRVRDLDFDTVGAALHKGAALSILADLEHALADIPPDQAGVRLHEIPAFGDLLSAGPIAAIAEDYLGSDARPVRAVLFDKSATTNWTLGWHQDRTIAVRAHHDLPGFGPWSVKAGVHHVEPPFAVIEAMITLRIHLDAVPIDNAPLLIAPGSHRLGRIAAGDAESVAVRIGPTACIAERGDVWAYATPILHASDRSSGDRHRRVLQVDFSAGPLPTGLDWMGI